MTNSSDLRYIKTEQHILDAFKACVRETGFERLQISAICRRALISRNTFYAHYEDKYALAGRLFDDLESTIAASTRVELVTSMLAGDFYEPVRWYIGLLARYREHVRLLLSISEQRFRDLLQKVYVDDLVSRVCPGYEEKSRRIENRIIRCYMVDGMVSFAKCWIDDMDRLDEEKAIRLMMELCAGPCQLYLRRMI